MLDEFLEHVQSAQIIVNACRDQNSLLLIHLCNSLYITKLKLFMVLWKLWCIYYDPLTKRQPHWWCRAICALRTWSKALRPDGSLRLNSNPYTLHNKASAQPISDESYNKDKCTLRKLEKYASTKKQWTLLNLISLISSIHDFYKTLRFLLKLSSTLSSPYKKNE